MGFVAVPGKVVRKWTKSQVRMCSTETRKTVLITGSTDGIGLHTATNLARMGYEVLVHGRSQEKVKNAVAKLREVGSAPVGEFVADFASLAEVKHMAEEVEKKYEKIDVLINNAGVFEPEKKVSTDGFEMTFAGEVTLSILSRVYRWPGSTQCPILMPNVNFLSPSPTNTHDSQRARSICSHGLTASVAIQSSSRSNYQRRLDLPPERRCRPARRRI